ncbi:MAG: hypothetical protein QOF36_1827, partial [Microbacteriaceae bacterium]|nr:hypothetical protein [Microbacteriaceae bacterium]
TETTGEVARTQLRAVRTAQRLSLREVSERVTAMGHDLSLSAVSKIENGTRRMDVDDLTALAAALGVAPPTLLLPNAEEVHDELSITGARGSAEAMWAWVTGQQQLPGADDAVTMNFVQHAFPGWYRREMAAKTREWLDRNRKAD